MRANIRDEQAVFDGMASTFACISMTLSRRLIDENTMNAALNMYCLLCFLLTIFKGFMKHYVAFQLWWKIISFQVSSITLNDYTYENIGMGDMQNAVTVSIFLAGHAVFKYTKSCWCGLAWKPRIKEKSIWASVKSIIPTASIEGSVALLIRM